jgi:hypothetical protein
VNLGATNAALDKLLTDKQTERLRQLNALERLLFRKLFEEIRPSLTEKDGVIVSRIGFVPLGKIVDRVFDAIEERGLQALSARTARDMKSVVDMNASYYRVIAVNRGVSFEALQASVDATMRRRLGIGDNGEPKSGGYITGLFGTGAAREEVKKMMSKAIEAKIPLRKLKKRLALAVVGTDETRGVLEKHIGNALVGVYNRADHIVSNQFGQRLGMKYFVYSGGIIETSRQFCRKKNGKVFSVEEAMRDWPTDPDLPRTKAEKDAGEVSDYHPLEDFGRWMGTSDTCRHRALYIDEETAFARRPDLRSGN